MLLNQERGSYALGTPVRLAGSFKYTASGNVVDTIRDGHSKCVASVVRNSAGNYTVTFDTGFPLPELLVTELAWTNSGATPTKVVDTAIVVGSYSRSTRSFVIVTTEAGSTASGTYVQPVVTDPDDGSRINFELFGSITSPGTDLA